MSTQEIAGQEGLVPTAAGAAAAISGGRFDFDDGGTYCGGWHEGKAHGHGVCTGPKGQGEYEGSWHFGFEVSGVYKWPSGATYEGTWQNGKRHGIGVEYRGKWVYKGEWTQGYKGRYGVRASLVSAAKYEGTWANGLQDGYGSETYADGGSYQGQWLRGMRHGYGVRQSAPYGHSNITKTALTNALGNKHHSLQSLDTEPELHGEITISDPKRETVRGGFVLVARPGGAAGVGGGASGGAGGKRRNSLLDLKSAVPPGTPLPSKGGLLKGLRLKKQRSTGDIDVRSNRSTGAASIGSLESGMTTPSVRDGGPDYDVKSNASFLSLEGEITDPTVTETYWGEWKNDKRCGFGICERSDGLRYEGEWYANKKYGYGVTTFKDGTREEGKYKNNVLVTSLRKKHLFLLRSTKVRERIESAVIASHRAQQIALQKADIAISRTATARGKAEHADYAASEARNDAQIAAIIAKQYGYEEMMQRMAPEPPLRRRLSDINSIRRKSKAEALPPPPSGPGPGGSLQVPGMGGHPQMYQSSQHAANNKQPANNRINNNTMLMNNNDVRNVAQYVDSTQNSNSQTAIDQSSLINQGNAHQQQNQHLAPPHQQMGPLQPGLTQKPPPASSTFLSPTSEPVPFGGRRGSFRMSISAGAGSTAAQSQQDNQQQHQQMMQGYSSGDNHTHSQTHYNHISHGAQQQSGYDPYAGGSGGGGGGYGTAPGHNYSSSSSIPRTYSSSISPQQTAYSSGGAGGIPNRSHAGASGDTASVSDHMDQYQNLMGRYRRAGSTPRGQSVERMGGGSRTSQFGSDLLSPSPPHQVGQVNFAPAGQQSTILGSNSVNVRQIPSPRVPSVLEGDGCEMSSRMSSASSKLGSQISLSRSGGTPAHRTLSMYRPQPSGGGGGDAGGGGGKLGVGGGGGASGSTLQRKPSLNPIHIQKATAPAMSREEVSQLSHQQREQRRLEQEMAEKLARNPLLYFTTKPFKEWLSRQQLIILVLLINISLAIFFFHLFDA